MSTAASSRHDDRPHTWGHSATSDEAVRRIVAGSDAITAAKHHRNGEALEVAKAELQGTVDAARDLGVSWQSISDAVGMRRGGAYQRFRHRRGT